MITVFTKVLIAGALLLPLIGHANAQATTNFYDSSGHKTGSATTYGNETKFYNDRGSVTGTGTRTGNTTTFRDPGGRTTGNASMPPRR